MAERLTKQAERLYEQASRMGESEAAAFLAREAPDTAVREQVQTMLAERRRLVSSLTPTDIGQRVAKAAAGAIHAARPPDRIGPYKILERLGEGGMGVVYLAEQTQPVRRRVALKRIKPGLDSEQVIARFEHERQALAMMDHAGIAQVFDADEDENGLPYFVMEYVPGVPITDFCERERLGTPERLRLFLQVCEAVHHAHQRAIMHRDLKPSNILVMMQDGRPQPKIIDFGVAKAVAAPLTERTVFTEAGQLIGTPEYMSPEQAEMTGLNVDIRTDIYSLGVVLYELLAGAPPFDARSLRSAGYDEVRRIIREVDPPKPSTRASEAGAGPKQARTRHGDPTTLSRQIRGDLDWIVMKAIEKDRTRRYESASAFGDDIQRHLRHEPVSAGPPSATYRARKFVRRNRALVSGVVAVSLAVILGLAGTTWQAQVAERARDRAAVRDEDGRALARAMLGDISGEITRLAGATHARELIAGAALEYLDGLAAEAGGDPAILNEVSDGYQRLGEILGQSLVGNVGDAAGAVEALERARDIRADLAADAPDNVLAQRRLAISEAQLSDALRRAGDTQAARERIEESLRIRRALAAANPGDDDVQRELADGLLAYGDVLRRTGERDEAAALFDESVEVRETLAARIPGDLDLQRDLSSVHLRLGRMASERGDNDAALTHYQRVRRVRADLVTADPDSSLARRDLMWAHYFVADPLLALGRIDEAAEELRAARAIAETRFTEDGANTEARRDLLLVVQRLGDIELWDRENAAGAIDAYQRAATLAGAAVQDDPDNATLTVDYGMTMRRLGDAQAGAGAHGEAVSAYARALELLEGALAQDASRTTLRPDIAWIRVAMGVSMREAGDAAGALPTIQAGVALFDAAGAPDSDDAYVRRDYAESIAELAATHWALGDADAAIETAERARAALEGVAQDRYTDELLARITDDLSRYHGGPS
jgi:serine/threonine protein kinase/tetratricopeptide (TPR) repeat protein